MKSASPRADLPFFLGLMEHLAQRGITCPQPVQNRDGEALRRARRPAGRHRRLSSTGVWPRRPSAGALRGARRGAGADCISPAPIFAMRRGQRAVGRGLARRCSRRWRARADEVRPACASSSPAELDFLEAALAARLPQRRHPCRSVSRQRVLPRRAAVRPDRFLFRLHRRPRLRRRDLPQRLVLRARPCLQRHQGARAARRLCRERGRCRPRSRRRCRCWRAARRCASC